jgi:hypothetical protein
MKLIKLVGSLCSIKDRVVYYSIHYFTTKQDYMSFENERRLSVKLNSQPIDTTSNTCEVKLPAKQVTCLRKRHPKKEMTPHPPSSLLRRTGEKFSHEKGFHMKDKDQVGSIPTNASKEDYDTRLLCPKFYAMITPKLSSII